jgi:hypothetical protein
LFFGDATVGLVPRTATWPGGSLPLIPARPARIHDQPGKFIVAVPQNQQQ